MQRCLEGQGAECSHMDTSNKHKFGAGGVCRQGMVLKLRNRPFQPPDAMLRCEGFECSADVDSLKCCQDRRLTKQFWISVKTHNGGEDCAASSIEVELKDFKGYTMGFE